MGWMSGWATRRALLQHLTEYEKIPKEDGSVVEYRTLSRVMKGNNMWSLMQRVDTRGDVVERSVTFIVLFMLRKFDGGTWGYKDVEASSGPLYYTCPVSWFERTTNELNEYETSWRKACLDAAARRSTLKHGKTLVAAQPIRFTDGVRASKLTIIRRGNRIRFKREDGDIVRLSRMYLDNADYTIV